MSDISFETFRTRPGTTDEGRIFEALTIANMCFDLTFNDDVTDFSLSSDENKMGAFDDIVLDFTYKDGIKKKFAMQLKYTSSDKRTLTIDSLMADRGDYSLKKYMDDYNKMPDKENLTTILLVKRNFDPKTTKEIGLTITQRKKKIPFFRKDKCYHIKQKNEDCRSFFNNFLLYVTDTNVKQIENTIGQKFCKKFSSAAKAKDYINFVKEWCSQNEKQKIKLNKSFIRRVIALNLLIPFIHKLSFAGVPEEKKLLFMEAALAFPVTYVSWEYKDQIVDVGVDVQNQIPDVGVCQKLCSYYQLTQEDLSILLWLTHKCPLIVIDNRMVHKAIEICPDMKFILLVENWGLQSLDNNRQFRSLADLRHKKPRIFDKILGKFHCTFQGKEISLRELLSVDHNISNLISTDELLLTTKTSLEIGTNPEILPISHMGRLVSQNIIDSTILENINEDIMILITCSKNLVHWLQAHYNCKDNITVKEEIFSQKMFQNFCSKYAEKECHHLRFSEDKRFEWVRSNCSIAKLKQFLSKDCFLPEQELSKYEDDVNVNIICGGPGMGKTTLMKNFSNHVTPKLWTIFLYVRNHSKHFREKGDQVEEFSKYILEKHEVYLTPFEFKIFKFFFDTGRVRILWDGLDELNDSNFRAVKSIIQQLSKSNSKHWITSRDNTKKNLEEEFRVVARKLKTFDEGEQKQYIRNRLKSTEEQTTKIFDQIQNNIHLFPNNSILEIPLQIHLLTELFVRDKTKYAELLNKTFSISDLYGHFVDEKFDIYFQEKENNVNRTDQQSERDYEYKNNQLTHFEKLAVKMYFTEKQLTGLAEIKNNDLVKIDNIGFIVNIVDGEPEFSHNSFGEYFAACYLAQNYSKISYFQDFFFTGPYDNIRFFFDLILSTNSKAHMAVLYRNWQLLDSCDDDDLKIIDKAGRSCLHLMCSWGIDDKLSNLPIKIDDLYVLKYGPGVLITILESGRTESADYIKAIEFLSEKCDPDQKDKLYNVDAFSYAQKSKCFLSLGIVTSISKTLPTEFHIYKKDILFYCLLYDYSNVLNIVQDMPPVDFEIFDIMYPWPHVLVILNSIQCLEKILLKKQLNMDISQEITGLTPIHLACKNNQFKIVEFLIKASVNMDRQDVNHKTPIDYAFDNKHFQIVKLLIQNGANAQISRNFQKQLIHEACEFGNFEIVELLLEAGVNAEVVDDYQRKPIHYACKKGHYVIVKLLIHRDVHRDVFDKFRKTPMHYACEYGHYDTVLLLLEAGVNAEVFDEYQNKPIHYACKNKHFEVVKMLILKGINADTPDRWHKTPIHYACENNHFETVKLITENGLSVDVADGDQNRPIHYACKTGNMEIVQLLIGQRVNVDVCGQMQKRAIHFACENGHFEIVKFLIGKGVDAEVCDCYNNRPIHYAFRNKSAKIVKFLLEMGVNADVPFGHPQPEMFLVYEYLIEERHSDNHPIRPIHYACQWGDMDIVEILAQQGVNLNSYDGFKMRPIHHACANGKYRIVEFLIKKEADVNVPDIFRRTPLHYACIKQDYRIALLLLNKGVNPTIIDVQGNKPVDYVKWDFHGNGWLRTRLLKYEK